MGPLRKAQLFVAAAAVLTVTGLRAQQMNYDPYNPQTRRDPPPAVTNSGSWANAQPSVIDMGFGTDQGNIGPFVTIPDKQFAEITASRALMQIQLGRKALDTTESADVKAVARQMIADYTKWGAGMRKAAAYLKIDLPAELDEKDQAVVDKICALSGPEFDEAYLHEVVHLANKALTVTQYEAANAGVTGFRHWSGVMIPKIQDDIRMAHRALEGEAFVSKREK
jgi:predicted outer membrane protein